MNPSCPTALGRRVATSPSCTFIIFCGLVVLIRTLPPLFRNCSAVSSGTVDACSRNWVHPSDVEWLMVGCFGDIGSQMMAHPKDVVGDC